MMFVSGATADSSPETTWIVEEIVREQVIELVCRYFQGLQTMIDSTNFLKSFDKLEI